MSICCVLMSSCGQFCCVTCSVLRRVLHWGAGTWEVFDRLSAKQRRRSVNFEPLHWNGWDIENCLFASTKPANRSNIPLFLLNAVALDVPGTSTYHNLLLRLQSGRALRLECRTHVPSCRKPPSTDFDTVNQIINVMLHVEQYKYG